LDNQKKIIESELRETILTKEKILTECIGTIERMGDMVARALQNRHKLLVCGNGGSAADAQHFAGELVGRFTREREALPAIALTTDSSVLTCLGNDYGFESVFSRQVEALGQPEDVLIGITTSGNSPNVLAALLAAQSKGMKTLALTGRGGGKIARMVDIALVVPSSNTQRIQESHITIIHILCSLIEQALIPRPDKVKVLAAT
jgi:D-sedoheptulose 7-phosphate isomerase